MKYHGHIFKKVIDSDVYGGFYYDIYKDGEKITSAWTLSNAKEFVDSFNGKTYQWNILA